MSRGSKKISGLCPLCEKSGPLCNSHIIPEFCYKGMYDDKGRALAVEAHDLSKEKFIQSGLKEYMLCPCCEGLINKYESVFYKEWFEKDRPAEMAKVGKGLLKGFSYKENKLFHLSVLFRAHFSKQRTFADVRLSEKQIKILRKYIFDGVAPDSKTYPVLCAALEMNGMVEANFIDHVHRTKYLGHWLYIFTFAGGQWLYFVSSHGLNDWFECRLKEDGSMFFETKKLLALCKKYKW